MKKDAFEILKADMEDLPSFTALVRELGYSVSREEMDRRLSAILDSRDHLLLVACCEDGRVAAFLHAHIRLSLQSGRLCEIGGLMVSAPFQGKGIGRSLVEGAKGWAETMGIGRLRVRSQVMREGAKRFYTGLGFSVTKEQRVFDRTL